jgi:hypothetical protein
VPIWALTVVEILSLLFVAALKGWVHHGSYAQHCLEALNLRVDFFVVLR